MIARTAQASGCAKIMVQPIHWRRRGTMMRGSLTYRYTRSQLFGLAQSSSSSLRVTASFLERPPTKDTARRKMRGKEKGSGVFSHDPLGRPRGRSVDSIPNRLAIRCTQSSSPKGRPRCTLSRKASNSDVSQGRRTVAFYFLRVVLVHSFVVHRRRPLYCGSLV